MILRITKYVFLFLIIYFIISLIFTDGSFVYQTSNSSSSLKSSIESGRFITLLNDSMEFSSHEIELLFEQFNILVEESVEITYYGIVFKTQKKSQNIAKLISIPKNSDVILKVDPLLNYTVTTNYREGKKSFYAFPISNILFERGTSQEVGIYKLSSDSSIYLGNVKFRVP